MKRFRWPFIAFIFCLVVFEVNGNDISTLGYYLASNIDSSTQGKIIESRLVPGGFRSPSSYHIAYAYNVDNVYYEFDLVNYHSKARDPKDVLQKYSVGKQVEVFYDSENPQYAVLENTSFGTGIYWKLAFAAFLFILLWRVDL